MKRKSQGRKSGQKFSVSKAAIDRPKAGSSKGADSKSIGYWGLVNNALRASFSFDKVLLYYIIALPMFLLLIWLGARLIALGNRMPQLLEVNPPQEVLVPIAGPLVLLVGYVIVLFFLQMFIRVGVVKNAESFALGKKKPVLESIKEAYPRYWPAIGATVIFTLAMMGITSLVGVIPAAGDILSNLLTIVFSLLFFFYLPLIVLADTGVFDSFKESYDIFIKKPWTVILMFLVEGLMQFVLILAFALVLLPFAWSTIAQIALAAPNIDTFIILGAIKANYTLLSAGVIVAAIVVAYMSVFLDTLRAMFYLRIRRL